MTAARSGDCGEDATAVVDTAEKLACVDADEVLQLDGHRVGRFTVIREIGRGGMGVVYAAYDDELDRRVALKLVALRHADDSNTHLRLHREAQALAKLSHPNVVAIYEVGRHEGFTFIAMEFVLGRTLREYLAQNPPEDRRLDVLIQAGRGLAAAHDAGLAHRDFKPGNVLVGDDGRVRVADFGLARAKDSTLPDLPGTEPPSAPDSVSQRRVPSLSSSVTTAGTLIGTPAYMAPEQLAGADADARADQYSFCVTMQEALTGQRPPPVSDRPKTPLRLENTTLPGRLRRIVARGLELEPERRYPSMDALLADLDRSRRNRHRTWAVLGLAGLAALVGYGLAGSSGPEPCQGLDRPLDAVWNDEVRAQVRAAALSSGLGYAEATADQVTAALDAYASTWGQTREDACTATRVQGTQSESTMDLRMACLDAALEELGATSRVLSRDDAAITTKAVSVAESLRPLSRCSDVEALLSGVAPPRDPTVRATVEGLRGRLADVKALFNAGRYEEAAELGGPLLVEADATGYVPIAVEIRHIFGRARAKTGALEEAAALLERAVLDGVAAGHDDVAIAAGTNLVFVAGHEQSRIDEAHRWWSFTDALVRRHGEDEDQVVGLASGYGSALEKARRLEDAQRQFERGLEVALSKENVDGRQVAPIYNNLGAVLLDRGEYAEAQEHFERATKLHEELLPPGHPMLGYMYANLAVVRVNLERHAEAEVAFMRALEIWRDSLDVDHPDVARVRVARATALRELGRVDEGREELAAAAASLRLSGGDDNPRLARVEHTLGEYSTGDEAIDHHRRALELRERALGGDHIQVAQSLARLAKSLRQNGKPDEARRVAQRAVEIARTLLGTDAKGLAKYEALLEEEPAN